MLTKVDVSIQDVLENKVHLNCTKTFSLKENLQNCSTDHAAAQECKKQLTRSHNAVVIDGTAKAGRCRKVKKRSIY